MAGTIRVRGIRAIALTRERIGPPSIMPASFLMPARRSRSCDAAYRANARSVSKAADCFARNDCQTSRLRSGFKARQSARRRTSRAYRPGASIYGRILDDRPVPPHRESCLVERLFACAFEHAGALCGEQAAVQQEQLAGSVGYGIPGSRIPAKRSRVKEGRNSSSTIARLNTRRHRSAFPAAFAILPSPGLQPRRPHGLPPRGPSG